MLAWLADMWKMRTNSRTAVWQCTWMIALMHKREEEPVKSGGFPVADLLSVTVPAKPTQILLSESQSQCREQAHSDGILPFNLLSVFIDSITRQQG